MLKIDLHKTFKSKSREVTISCNAQFESGQITALYGASGIGKTTVLRMIAGLEVPDSGTINYKDNHWFNGAKKVALKGRCIGMVFQDYNLFKNMSVLQNLAYAANGLPSDQVNRLIDQLGIKRLLQNYPHELSKGQQQKVAILRALCLDNEVLLLDEPFSALDDDSILELMDVLSKLKSELNLTIILVTHRKDVILKMADSVVDMAGNQQGKPKEQLTLSF